MARLFHAPVLWCLPAYLLLSLLVGALARRRSATAQDFLNAGRALPAIVVVAAYLAANCGALEIIGLSAMAAQYGVQAFHFYWIGAIPAMIFLAMFMMPVYRLSGVRSVPEYLLLRYGPDARLLNASSTAIVLLLLSGISLYAMAQVLAVILGLGFAVSVAASALVVLLYVLLGGVRATIYNELLQLVLMLAGLAPLTIHLARSTTPALLAGAGPRSHLWQAMPLLQPHATLDVVGVVFGLGFVLSFSYWCTDFVMMQRALMARTQLTARQVPLWAGFGKLAFSLIVVLPGLAAYRLLPALGHGQRYDRALPALMQQLYSPVWLGIGLTALAASLMFSFAANVSAFASIWTEDIYRARLQPARTERHYLRMARAAIVAAVLLSIMASWLNFLFVDLMEHVQLIFSVLGSPFFAVFLLGMLTRKVTERGAIAGFVSGAAFSFAHSLLALHGVLSFGSTMSANFYAAIESFALTVIVSLLTSRDAGQSQSSSTRITWKAVRMDTGLVWLACMSFLLLAACAVLNYIWR